MALRFLFILLFYSFEGWCNSSHQPADTLIDGKIIFKTGAKIFKKWKLTDTSFTVLDTLMADSFYAEGKHIVRCLNDQKQIVFPKSIGAFYTDIQAFETTFRIKKDSLFGLMNEKGQIVLPCEYNSISFLDPYFGVSKNNQHSFRDSIGNSITVSETNKMNNNSFYFYPDSSQTEAFDSLSVLSSQHKLGWKNGKASLLDHQMHCISDYVFRDVKQITDSTITAFDAQSVWHFNLKNDSICKLKMGIKWAINDTLGLVQIRDTLFGVYHFRSDTMMYFEADSVWRHPNMPNRLMTKRGDTLGLASIQGRLLTNYERKYRFIGLNENGFLQVISKRYFGFIDTNGYLLIATQYDSVKKVTEGFAPVKLRGKWGFVDRKERIVVQPIYQKVGSFMCGTAPVWYNGLSTLTNSNGKELFPPRFQDISPTKQNHWLTLKNGRYGFLRSDGVEVHIPRFERVEEISSGFYIVRQYGKEGVLSSKLEVVVPLIEKRIENIKGTDFFVIQK